MTYHVLPIGVTVTVIYLFTLYLSRSGFTPGLSHRRFWNWVLLFSFLISGLFGLFLALRITYRWEIPFAESVRHWHVEAGSAMVFAAMIHLTWHLSYYLGRKGKRTGLKVPAADINEPEAMASPRFEAGFFRPLLMLTGFVSSASQFILMREALILGGGTEAIAGLFLWLWLIIAAVGSVTGARSAITSPGRMMWTLIGCTLLAPALLLMMTTIVLSPGQTPSFLQALVIMAVSVAPVTFISALVFVRISVLRNSAGHSVPGNSFGIETGGSVAAGLVTALTVTLAVPNFQLYLLILVVAAAILAWLLDYGFRQRITVSSVMLAAVILLFLFPPDPAVRSLMLRGIRVTESRDTPFGNITTGYYGDERTIFYDHRPLYFEGDVTTTEENIHYALLQREDYDRVLLISGGLKRHLPELMKHPVERLDYLEIDPGLIAAEGAHDTLCDEMQVRIVRSDPLTFLMNTGETYDAVIQLIPPPSTLSVSRFFTTEYFRLVSEHLTAGGIFACTPMPWFNYSPESYRDGFSPYYNAISAVFNHVTLIPGTMLHLIASDAPVSAEPARMAAQRGIENSYVNGDYIDDAAIKTKKEQIISHVDRDAAMNSAARPVSALFSNILSLERMGMKGGIIALLAFLIAIPVFFAARRGLMMFASSACLAGFGMISVFILQMAIGNFYILSSVILTLIMAGLAAGAVLGDHVALRKIIICTLLLTAVFTLTGILAPVLVTASHVPVLAWLGITLPTAGFITGAVYRILTSRNSGEITGRIYAADMAGSALGYLTVATILVPLAGTSNACFILAVVILTAGTIASTAIKQ
jgi:spermidine synthase